jgi:hypothetical protein
MTRQELVTDPAQRKPHAAHQPYCLLVSSCDAYADCWLPFFTLLARYWQPKSHEIYLSTETKGFAFPGLTIRCPRVGLTPRLELAWSDRLLRCLEAIPYEIVLYLQEDYFLTDTVDVDFISYLVELMKYEAISHIGLERGLTAKPGPKSVYAFLSYIDQRAEYRISAQAGLWKVSALKSYLRRHEDVWEFEWYGTRRAWRRPDTLMYVDADYEAAHGKKVMPYEPTGIVQGRWVREIVEDLFLTNGIAVDYDSRGFHDPSAIVKRAPLH